MRTSSPISTISYNTDSFLIQALNSLVEERYIDFWAFIQHLPEEDEKKAHKHLYVVPARLLDSSIIANRLEEQDINNPDKPLGCISFQTSKFIDWYLYILHDVEYLASKGHVRKYHYTKDEIVCNDIDFLNECYARSNVSKYKKITNFKELANSGVSFRELVENGHVPIQQIIQWKKAYNLFRFGKMDFDENVAFSNRCSDEFESGGEEGASCAPLKPSRPRRGEILYNDFAIAEKFGMEPVFGQPLPFGDELYASSDHDENYSDIPKNE